MKTHKAIDKRNIKDILGLTPMQEGLLFHYLSSPQKDFYFEQLCLNLSGPIDFDTMKHAWNDVVEQNDMLRTLFKWDNVKHPIQVVLKKHNVQFHAMLPPDSNEPENETQHLEVIKTSDRERAFDLQEVPFRITAGKLGDNRGFMIISHHHILYDGWSNGIIIKEFFEAYNSRLQGKQPAKHSKTQFKHFVKWQKDGDKEKQAAYWKNHLAGYDLAIELPGKKISSEIKGQTSEVQLRLAADLKEKADLLVKDQRLTLATLLYTTWGILLQRYTASDDVILGTTVAGRSARVEGIEDMVGLFINTLPLRIQTKDNETVTDLLLQVDRVQKERQEYEHTPLTDIKMYGGMEGRGELFDTILALENYPLDKTLMQEESALCADSFSMQTSTHYDLTVSILLSETIDIMFSHNNAVLDKAVVGQMAQHFKQIFNTVVHRPEHGIATMEMLTEEERHLLLVKFNDTAAEMEDKTIDGVFGEHVAKNPDAIAVSGVVHDHGSGTGADRKSFPEVAVSITYKQLDTQAGELAHRLRSEGVRPDTIVALVRERSVEMIIGIMGILKAGGAYLPIDPKAPAERISYMLMDSTAPLLVTSQSISPAIDHKIKRIIPDASDDHRHMKFCPPEPGNPDRLAYVIYTSGTTGKPKGTLIPHSNVVGYVGTMDYLELNRRDRMLQVADYTFDISVFNIYSALLNGAELVMPEREDFSALDRLADIAIKKDITTFFMPTGLFNALVEVDIRMFASVRNILVGGEALSPSHCRKVLEFIKANGYKNRLINGYGPTETTVYSTYYFINELPENAVNVPIGRPVPNTTIFIADKNKNLTPPGVAGELFIGGTSLARGYLNRPELTAEKFTEAGESRGYDDTPAPDRVSPTSRGEVHPTLRARVHPTLRARGHPTLRGRVHPTLRGRVYRTGDLVRWLPDGNIQYLGRIDQQVKIRGFRIEPDEIRNALLGHPSVTDAVVLAREYESGEKFICAYIVSTSHVEMKAHRVGRWENEIRDYLSDSLPDYMVPAHFVYLDHIPLTINGKVDTPALPAPEEGARETAYRAPRNAGELLTRKVWAEVLKISTRKISIDDNFFHLGGHSLNATVLLAQIHKHFHVKISMSDFFKAPTVSRIYRKIEEISGSMYSAVEPVEKKEYYPLSAAQKRLYFLDKFEGIGTGYNMTSAFFISSPSAHEKNSLSHENDSPSHGKSPHTHENDSPSHGKSPHTHEMVEQLEKIFNQLATEHEALRTSFMETNGEPAQRIHPEAPVDIRYRDLSDNRECDEKKLSETITGFVRPFDLSKAPLLRVELLKIATDRHLLLFDMHHIIGDGSSMGILARDFARLYNGEQLQRPYVQYKDFAAWQNRIANESSMEEQSDYWSAVHGDDLPVLNLPTDFARPALFSFAGDHVDFELDAAATSTLKAMADENDLTLYMVLISAFNIFLHKYTGQEDIVVGNVIMGRPHADLQDIVGMFVNTLPMRCRPTDDKTLLQLLEEMKTHSIEAFENQDIQFEHLVEILNPRRDPSRNPIFDACFVLRNMDFSTSDLPLLEPALHIPENKTAKFDLTLGAEEAGEKVRFSLEYCTALFRQETIQRMAGHLLTILRQMKENPSVTIGELELLSEKEKQCLLIEFNDTAVPFPGDKSIYQLFAQQVEKTPDSIALTGAPSHGRPSRQDEISLTYKQLDFQVLQLAHILRSRGVRKDTIVALALERSLEMIISIMGILSAGGAYLPIAPDYPAERISYMLKDSDTRFLVTTEITGARITTGIERIHMDTSLPHKTSGPGMEPKEYAFSETGIDDGNSLAYVIYTSGTTGKPKGTLTQQANVIRVVRNQNYIVIKNDDRMLQLSNYAFDGSVFDIYGALLNGAQLEMPGKEDVREVEKVCGIIEKKRITVCFITTALFNTMVDLRIGTFAGVRKLLFGGERISLQHAGKALEYLGGNRLIHVYGPTETTVYATYYFINHIDENAWTLPIGGPLTNTCLFVADKNLNLCPIGATGELFIGGPGLARGYLNHPQLTADTFIATPHSWQKGVPPQTFARPGSYEISSKIYRTGDLVRWLPDGNIEFIDRIDQQVKVRGFRIELGEIKNALLQYQPIKDAVVIAKKYASGEKFLCAYIVAEKENVQEVRDYLSTSLPDYMVPAHILKIDSIPLTANGKVDMKALPVPGEGARETAYTPPRNAVETKIREAWAEVLQIPIGHIGIDDNFFHLGGHSLKATVLTALIHKTLKVKIPMGEFFQTPTIRGLGRCLERIPGSLHTSIKAVEKREYYSLSAAQKRLYFLDKLDDLGTGYNMPSIFRITEPRYMGGESPPKSRLEVLLRQLVTRHEALRTSFLEIEGVAVQRVCTDAAIDIEYFRMPKPEKEKHSESGQSAMKSPVSDIAAAFIRPFDLAVAPLLRVGLATMPGGEQLLLFDMHHIIGDGTSMGILARDFAHLYNGEKPEPANIQYKDFTAWQNDHLQGGIIEGQADYWRSVFQGDELPVLDLPTDFPRPAVFSFAGDHIAFETDPETTAGLKELGRNHEATLYMVLMTAFTIFLHKYTGREDIVVGNVIMGRPHADLRDIVGMFVNTLPMRSFPLSDKNCLLLLKETKQQGIAAFENQDIQFEHLVEILEPQRDPSRNPIFDVCLVFQNMELFTEELPLLTPAPHLMKNKTAKFDITLTAEESGEKVRFSLEYCTALFRQETIQRMAGHLLTILRQMKENPSVTIG
ncbi:MAG: amino acid adenylation domain-containing protein, partial [bacterium]|nr:amino acid adenylation domain-containing protein [bacterium]